MVRKANVILYKSNRRTFKDEDWRYAARWDTRERTPADLNRFKLEYRIVLEGSGGICTSSYSWDHQKHNGLSERAYEFISDILAVAQTLGWNTLGSATNNGLSNREWESRKKQEFICDNGETLMEVRAYQNQNMHIKFNQQFMKKLNVEFGRLKGWLKDHHQAAEELRIKPEEAAEFFHTTFQLTASSSKLLLASPDADITTASEPETFPKQETPKDSDNPATKIHAIGACEQLKLIDA